MIINNKQDNEVYILGSDTSKSKNRSVRWKWLIVAILALSVIAGFVFFILSKDKVEPDYYFEPETNTSQSISIPSSEPEYAEERGHIAVTSDTINDVPLTVFIPHNAEMSLQLGLPDKSDTTIIYTAMAADIRKDNEQIVGDFVLSGNQLSRGVAKKGFCAIVDNAITIGVGDETPLLQQAIDNKGAFFRQYPLVHSGELIENRPKNKSIRRALGIRGEQVVMVQSQNIESFHDFSQALIDSGISDAIYLVGGNAYGWYNKDNILHEFGKELPDVPENISYIVWRIK